MDGARPPPSQGLAQAPSALKSLDKGKRDEWSEGGVLSLLDVYESKWVLRNRAKLKGSDWDEIARQVSTRSSGTKAFKTPTQCKNKIEAMKKRYRSESAAAGSSWQFYARMDSLVKGAGNSCVVLPKANLRIDLQALPKAEVEAEADGLLHDSNHDGESNTMQVELDGHAEDNNNGKKMENRGTDSQLSASRSKRAAADGYEEPNRSSKRMKLLESELAESIRMLAQSMLQIEQARLEMYKDSERMRAEADIKRGELELKKTEIIANTQLKIAKLFVKEMHRSSKSGNPSLRTELNILPTWDEENLHGVSDYAR